MPSSIAMPLELHWLTLILPPVTFGATATHCLIGRRRGHEYRDRRKLATDEMFQVIIVLASRKKGKPSRFLPNWRLSVQSSQWPRKTTLTFATKSGCLSKVQQCCINTKISNVCISTGGFLRCQNRTSFRRSSTDAQKR
jgi:hypothetical protein